MIDGYVHPAFGKLADQFRKLFTSPGDGGGALAAYQEGEKVLDIWAGYADGQGGAPWRRDTMAMSFSTTKGVATTIIHRLADRGLIDYDDPVAKYWPAFGANGKDDITIRHVMTHRAGLHNARDLVDEGVELLDHKDMEARLAAARPSPPPGTSSGYHAFTYGWLLSGLARAVTGESMKDLFRTEIAEPLGVEDDLFLGAPDTERPRVAWLFPKPPDFMRMVVIGRIAARFATTRGFAQALVVDGFHDLLFEEERRILDTQMPAVNGVFTARALARLYGALARGGSIDGVRVLTEPTLRRARTVQTRRRDYVLGVTMSWRLGYHKAFSLGDDPERGFGHYGYGGSGGWADPETGFGLAFITNRLASLTTPLADARLIRLNRHALKAARRVDRHGL